MSDTKSIKWIGGEGFLPVLGSVKKGVIKENVLNYIADNYIKQGLAEEVKAKTNSKKKEIK